MGTWHVKLLDCDGDWLGIEWGVDSRAVVAERLNEDWSWLKRPASTRVGRWEVETLECQDWVMMSEIWGGDAEGWMGQGGVRGDAI